MAVLLLQFLDLLEGEERAATTRGLLWVPLQPPFHVFRVAALDVEAQVLLMLRGEVAELTGEGLAPCRGGNSSMPKALSRPASREAQPPPVLGHQVPLREGAGVRGGGICFQAERVKGQQGSPFPSFKPFSRAIKLKSLATCDAAQTNSPTIE